MFREKDDFTHSLHVNTHTHAQAGGIKFKVKGQDNINFSLALFYHLLAVYSCQSEPVR